MILFIKKIQGGQKYHVEAEGGAVEEVDDAAGRADDDVRAPPQLPDVVRDVHACQ